MNETKENPVTAENPQSDAAGDVSAELERLVGDLFGIGRTWAAHGLTVGRSALEASARSLDVTARMLGDLARRFDGTKEPSAGR